MLESTNDKRIWDDYGEWLIDRISSVKTRAKAAAYHSLLIKLHRTQFRYIMQLDENRASDGIRLRDDYALSRDRIDSKLTRKCSVLEMLVGLAIRIEYEYIGDPKDEHPDLIFWEMIDNLFDTPRNYHRLTNRHFDPLYVDKMLDIWMSRGFDYDGNGSIFPLKEPSRDQRSIDIWSQMNEYLTENYPY